MTVSKRPKTSKEVYSREEVNQILDSAEQTQKNQIEWFREWVELQTDDTFTRQQILNYLDLQ